MTFGQALRCFTARTQAVGRAADNLYDGGMNTFLKKSLRWRKRIVVNLAPFFIEKVGHLYATRHFPWTLADLHAMTPNSLGQLTAMHLDKLSFTLLTHHETHDFIHTLVGYNNTPTGEIRLQAFMFGNGGGSLFGRILFIPVALFLPEMWPKFKIDIRAGLNARLMTPERMTSLAPLDIEDARHYLNIVPI